MLIEQIRTNLKIFKIANISINRIFWLIALTLVVVVLDTLGISILLPIGEYILSLERGTEPETYSWNLLNKFFRFFNLDAKIAYVVSCTILIIILRQLTNYTKIVTAEITKFLLVKNLRMVLFNKFMMVDFKYNKSFSTGSKINLINKEIDNVGTAAIAPFELISGVMILTAYLAIMTILSYEATLILLFCGSIMAILIKKINVQIQNLATSIIRLNNQFSEHFVDRFLALKLIKLNNMYSIEMRNTGNILEKQYKNNVKLAKISAITATGVEPLVIAVAIPLLVFAVSLGFPLSILGMFAILLARFVPTLKSTIEGLQSYIRFNTSSITILDILKKADLQKEEIKGEKNIPKPIKEIVYKNVYFKYLGDNDFVINNFSCTIRGGQINAISGPSGSGKTTLVNLLPRLLNSSKGDIFINDRNLNKISIEELRKNCAYIDQSPIFIRGSVFDHITYNKDNIGIEKCIYAAKLANAHDFIANLPNQYNYFIGESGSGLSGGQLQRLEIARGIASEKPIMILDEPTSNLDHKNELEIFQTLNKINEATSITMIVITHKKALLKFCSNIIEIK